MASPVTLMTTRQPCLPILILFAALQLPGSCASQAQEVAKPTLPGLAATKAVDLPGLHNVVAYTPGVVGGAVPEGSAGLRTLAMLGVRTVISVDGATPEVAQARALGIRYVHLPIGYDEVPAERARELARALQVLPGPVYVHCHHGKHRSAAAAGTACVLAGLATPEEMLARMQVSGTSPEYAGLFASVRQASPAPAAELAKIPTDFPEVSKVSGMVETMTEIDTVFDLLKQVRAAGFAVPKQNPDLVPVKEARRLTELLTSLRTDAESAARPADFRHKLDHSIAVATAFADGLATPGKDRQALEAQFAKVQKSCKDCHTSYRDKKN